MAKMEHLGSFLIERLMAVAGEIYEAVKDTVSDYQEEIERTKQENRQLWEKLTEISFRANSETLHSGVHPTDGTPLEQDSNQRQPNSDPSVLQLKLKVATIKQEAEPQVPLNDAPSSTSPIGKSAYGTWTTEQQNTIQGPQDPEPSLLQVKLELATVQEENAPEQQLSTEKHSYGQDPASFNIMDVESTEGDDQHGNSITIKLEQSDFPLLSGAQVQSGNHLDPMESDLSSTAAHWQSHLTEKFFRCSLCNKPFRSAWLWKKHMIACHKERPHICDLCGKSYADANVLRAHLKTHTSERPFQCEFCGKMYKKKCHLKDHERTHTGDKRYSCSACGMCFIWTNQVKVHIRNHHRGEPATVLKKQIT